MEKQHKFSIWYVLLGIWVVLLIQNVLSSYLAIKTIPYSEFLELLKQRRVSEVAISVNQIQGKMLVDDRDPNKSRTFQDRESGS
jgi:cell division protease FtsH